MQPPRASEKPSSNSARRVDRTMVATLESRLPLVNDLLPLLRLHRVSGESRHPPALPTPAEAHGRGPAGAGGLTFSSVQRTARQRGARNLFERLDPRAGWELGEDDLD